MVFLLQSVLWKDTQDMTWGFVRYDTSPGPINHPHVPVESSVVPPSGALQARPGSSFLAITAAKLQAPTLSIHESQHQALLREDATRTTCCRHRVCPELLLGGVIGLQQCPSPCYVCNRGSAGGLVLHLPSSCECLRSTWLSILRSGSRAWSVPLTSCQTLAFLRRELDWP